MNWKKNVNLFLSMMLAFSTFTSDMTVYAESEEETEKPVIEEVTEIEETAESEVTEIVSEMEEMTDNVISEENGSEEEITDVTGSEEAEPEEDLSEQIEELAPEEDNSSEEIQTEEEEPVISFAGSGDFEYSISDGEAIIDKYSGNDAEVTIPSQIDGYTVTGIAKNVFSSNKDLTKISLPATLKSIGQSAFSNCENLNDVQIPNSVASIGSSAFMSCKSITSITIPDSVTSIGSFAFGYCNNLASVTISENVTSIGGEVFRNCPKLKTAGPIGSNCDIEYGWTTMIPYDAFSYTESLTSITFPQGIKEIGGSAFSGCSGLTSVEIPETVTKINHAAFSGCTGLSSVKIPHFLMMENSVFYGCTELKTAGPIESSSNFEFGWSESIPANAFNGDNCLTSIVIPDGVTYIGYDAFDGCTNLASVTLPGSLTEISAYQSGIFNNCPKLTTAGPIGSGSNIEFGWTTSIPAFAFSECSSLTSVVIPEGITEIGGLAFSKCTDLTKVIIPESVAETGSVGSGIFRDNPKLVSAGPIDSDSNIEFGWTTAIPERAFYDCKYLTKVIIPSGITEIGYTAFNNCEGLKTAGPTGSDSNIEFPWTDAIPDSAFSGCTGLTKVTIPDTVTSIGENAFSWCTNLTDITLPDGITSIGSSAFSVCSSLTKINIPKNVTFIVASVFSRCSSLISIEIPYGVTNIGGDAFRSCTSLASVTIPETMGEIYDSAFTECSAIKDVYYSGTEEDWQKISIGDDNNYLLNATIHYKPVALRELQINAEDGEIILHAGENRTLEVTRIPASSAEQLYWDSSDENTLTVDQNGTVTAVKSGSAVITVRNEDGSVSDTVEIIVAVEVTGITLNKTEGTLAKGEEDQLTATVKPDNATIKDVKWSSSDQSVLKVDENGHVTAVGGGTAVVTAEADGGLTAFCTYTVLVPVTGVLAEESMIAFIGKDTSLNYQIKPSDATNKNVTFTVGNTEIAKVSADGVITGLKLGETDITIKTEDGGYQAVVHVTVVPDGIYMDPIEESYAYTGSAIKPAVRLYDQGTLLKEKTDYTVTYANNTKAGTAKITIKMARDYKGTITKTFEITPIDLNDPSVTCDALTLAETGKTLSPVPVLYFNGKKLKNKTDYTVDYTGWDRLTGDENNEAVITVIGKENGNFSGERKVTIFVAPKGTAIPVSKLKVTAAALKYEDLTEENFAEKVADAITVKDGKTGLQEGINYTIKDIKSEDRAVGSFKVTLEGKDSKYIGERTITVKITGIALTDKKVKNNEIGSYVYNGKPQTLHDSFYLTYGDKTLEEGKDYQIASYTNNVNAGKASVKIQGINGYTGTRTVTFTIAPNKTNITAEDVSYNTSVEYAKGGAKPTIKVSDPQLGQLTAGKDYTVKYANNTKLGDNTASFTLTFTGNYKGTPALKQTYSVVGKNIAKTSLTVKDVVWSASAGKYRSTPALKDTDGKALKAGTDYQKTYTYELKNADGSYEPLDAKSVVPAGSVIRITVEGKDKYSGTISGEYKVMEATKNIAKAVFTVQDQEYTGRAIRLTAGSFTKAVINSKDLTYGVDYKVVSYTNNIKKGTATAVLQGIGEYGGTKTVKFKINSKLVPDIYSSLVP